MTSAHRDGGGKRSRSDCSEKVAAGLSSVLAHKYILLETRMKVTMILSATTRVDTYSDCLERGNHILTYEWFNELEI